MLKLSHARRLAGKTDKYNSLDRSTCYSYQSKIPIQDGEWRAGVTRKVCAGVGERGSPVPHNYSTETYLWNTSISHCLVTTQSWPVTQAIVDDHVVPSKSIFLVLHYIPRCQVEIYPMSLTHARWMVPNHHEGPFWQQKLGRAATAMGFACCWRYTDKENYQDHLSLHVSV